LRTRPLIFSLSYGAFLFSRFVRPYGLLGLFSLPLSNVELLSETACQGIRCFVRIFCSRAQWISLSRWSLLMDLPAESNSFHS